jgi:putative hydrolase of HD superfamily
MMGKFLHGPGVPARLLKQMAFLLEMDKLKTVLRRTPLLDNSRPETDAEHCWELAVMAIVLAEYAEPPIDLGHVLKLVAVHDIVEIDAGDTFLYDDSRVLDQLERERDAAARLFALLPDDQACAFRALWDEFIASETPEARFAKALDRLQPLLHNYFSGGGTWKTPGVNSAIVHQRKRVIGLASPTLWRYGEHLLARAVEDGLLAPPPD